MDCLEDKLDDLTPECKKVMERFIEEDEEEPELNEIFREECGPVIKEHCQVGLCLLCLSVCIYVCFSVCLGLSVCWYFCVSTCPSL